MAAKVVSCPGGMTRAIAYTSDLILAYASDFATVSHLPQVNSHCDRDFQNR